MNVLVGVVGRTPAWSLPGALALRLRDAFPEHTFLMAGDYEAIRRQLPEADVAFTALVEQDIFPALTRLRWIQAPAAAVGHLLFPSLVERGVLVTNARGLRARAMAEHVVAVAIALARKLPLAMRAQVSHAWAQEAIEGSGEVRTLRGCHAGVIGMGAVGREVALLLSACGLRVTGVRRRAVDERVAGVEELLPSSELDCVLRRSDVLVLCVPLTRETRGLLGAGEIAAMKPGAFLVNVGRGELVDDGAVVNALRSGHLGGAALDVFPREPLERTSPYWDLPNVIVTPHVSGASSDYWCRLVDLFSENLRRFDRGEPLLNQVDTRNGY